MTAPDDLVRRLYEEFMNGGDRSTADELIADSFVDHSNPASGTAGKQELIELVLSARAADPTLTSTVVTTRTGGELAMVQVASSIGGTDWRELHVFRVADERIVERWGLRTRTDASQV